VKVTVFGATGQLGKVTVPALVAAGHDVVAVVRRDEQIAEVAAAGATGVLADLEGGGDLSAALDGADAVVWAAGANVMTGPEHSDRVDRDGALRAIKAAADAGVGRWIQVSSMFANRWEQGPEVLHHFLQNKAAADAAVQESGLSWTILRPGGLGNDEPTGKVEIAEELGWGRITRPDVAAVIVELLDSGRGENTGFDLGNGETPIADAIAAL
jgi:uncharacterized protein YbjT (DUF2867 family)